MQRKYFGTDGIRGKVGEFPITPEFVLKLGWAAGCIFAKSGLRQVLIGKDTRVSGYMFESALESGLSAAGMDSHLLGPMPTPAIAYLTRALRAQAGIVISASHNPYYDNGIKFFSSEGTKLADDLELLIEEQLDLPMKVVEPMQLGKAVRVTEARGRYIEFCKNSISEKINLKGLKIVVDCANGATYHIAADVFRELGAEVIELGTEPDGFNINENCGSTCPAVIKKIVQAEEADLGIAFDGDGDRVIMIDAKGEIVDGDELLFILAKEGLRTGKIKKQEGIVGTLMSNLGLELAIREAGLNFVRAKVGDRYVLEELNRTGWHLGGETSGHIICLQATTTGDGIIAALQVLAVMSQRKMTLHELKSGMRKFPQVLLNVKTDKKLSLDQNHIQKAVHEAETFLGDRGRVLLRASGTEPVIRVMVEGENQQQVEKIANDLVAAVKFTAAV